MATLFTYKIIVLTSKCVGAWFTTLCSLALTVSLLTILSMDPALQKKIIRQVEFYFGDRNLRRDEFLREQIKKGDGCIQLACSYTDSSSYNN